MYAYVKYNIHAFANFAVCLYEINVVHPYQFPGSACKHS